MYRVGVISMSAIIFEREKKIKKFQARTGVIKTSHGEIKTPAFVAVGTKATVKALNPEQIKSCGVQVVLGNTYHLYLEPGEKTVEKAGGLGKFMGWQGPTITDSGGYQVFSLGAGFENGKTKFVSREEFDKNTKKAVVFDENLLTVHEKLAQVDEDGVTFTSHLNGSLHRFTPERSVEIQHALGADIFFAFDECTSPLASYEYQKEAMNRTHEWAKRSLRAHRNNTGAQKKQAVFGIVQGGPYEDLRKESAKVIADMDFDGYGIGGSYTKEEVGNIWKWIGEILPPEKPRHLLGIGEPLDFFVGVEGGGDTFDCVAPTRLARNGTLYTNRGKITILNAEYREDFSPIEEGCRCYTCSPRPGGVNFTKSYVAHLLRSKEILGATLASIHNMYFISNLVENIRISILEDRYFEFKEEFTNGYLKT